MPGISSYLHDRDVTLFTLLTFSIHILHWFLHQIEIWVDVYLSKGMTRDSSDRQGVMYVYMLTIEVWVQLWGISWVLSIWPLPIITMYVLVNFYVSCVKRFSESMINNATLST